MPDLKEFRLGIIGGCLSHQSDIPHSMLYHRQLDRMLQEREGIRLKVSIARHFNHTYRERLDELLDEVDVDGVLLHLRVVFVGKSVLLVNRLVEGKRYYRLNPFLFRQNETGWNKSLAAASTGHVLFSSKDPPRIADTHEDPYDRPVPSKKVFGFRLRSLNLALGGLVGLDDWAIKDEFAMFEEFRIACADRGIPFFVLGPTPATTYSAETNLWRKMNDQIRVRLPEVNTSFCPLEQLTDEDGNNLLQGDGFHLNIFGHSFVARSLNKKMTPWLKKTFRVCGVKWT